MSFNSKIEWTETTWNPVTGCSKISEGCQYCYAEVLANRLKAMHNPKYFNGFEVTLHYDLLKEPLRWIKPRVVFANSMSDLFHEKVPNSFIKKVFQTISRASQHTFQILTKRSKRLKDLSKELNWPDNLWMGVTVELNKYVYRIEDLKETSAKVKYISFEPLLGNIDIVDYDGIDWVIVGGESGPKSRVMKKEWVINIKNEVSNKNIPFFFKQWGGKNKKKNGRLLDGKLWNQMPSKQNNLFK